MKILPSAVSLNDYHIFTKLFFIQAINCAHVGAFPMVLHIVQLKYISISEGGIRMLVEAIKDMQLNAMHWRLNQLRIQILR